MLKHWEFWFATIAALLAGTFMFDNLKQELAITQVDIRYIKSDVQDIKERLNDSKSNKISIGLAQDVR